jgi:hypothetical protein
MRFRADEVRFVDEQDSLVNQADSMPVASAMNGDIPPFDMGPSHMGGDDFGGNTDFM